MIALSHSSEVWMEFNNGTVSSADKSIKQEHIHTQVTVTTE